jgi:creatinine amidohydrolase
MNEKTPGAALRMVEMTWEEVRDVEKSRTIAILPIGAIEAHGPHLPLGTDIVIAEAMADSAAKLLAARGILPLLLPSLPFTPASFAASFPGTISISSEAAEVVLLDIARSLHRAGFVAMAIASPHLDPTHLASLHAAVLRIRRETGMAVAFPDLTQRPWALRLTEEFKSGACHAGQFETSIVMAAHPNLVRDALRRGLEANPASLSIAIREGRGSFEEAGGPRAYFGYPAEATAAEGTQSIAALGEILAEAAAAEMPA